MLDFLQTLAPANAEFDASARNYLERSVKVAGTLVESLWRPLRLENIGKPARFNFPPAFPRTPFPDSCKANPRLTVILAAQHSKKLVELV